MAMQNLLYLFPDELRDIFRIAAEREADLQEIRLRAEKPIYVIAAGQEQFLDRQGYYTGFPVKARILRADELVKIVNHICRYSLYAFEDELKQGFLTVPGGHRVGIVGQAVINDRDEVRTLKHISGLNIRVAHQIKGAADRIMPYIYHEGKLKNTIIISPPGGGKTTLLRDMIRQVSDGSNYGRGISVGVVDERSEIAGCFQGRPQNDVGIRTDVLDSCPKAKGMMMLIRSMSPGAVAIDELGDMEEWKALMYASYCGTAVLATMHGEGLEDYKLRRNICLTGQQDIFQVCIVLKRYQGKCMIAQIYEKNSEDDWICLWQK